MMACTKTLVIIPAYNEEASIGGVIRSLQAHVPEADILVVNDGSADRTAAVAAEQGAHVISLPYNLGIGGAVQTGYLFAREHGYSYAVQVDADGQHDPADLPNMLEQARLQEADMILGSRYVRATGYRAPFMRRVGMLFLSGLISLLTRTRLTDTTSGYRVVNRRVIELFSQHYPTDYPEPETLVWLLRKGYKVVEVPTEMHQRQASTSSITTVRAAYYMVKVALSMCISAVRYPRRKVQA